MAGNRNFQIKVGVSAATILFSTCLLWFNWGAYPWAWLGGLVFAVAVVMWSCRSTDEWFSWRSGGFLVIATLIYRLDHWLFREHYAYFKGVVGPYGVDFIMVVLETTLLPIAQVLLLRVSWKRAIITISCLFGLWLACLKLRDPLWDFWYPRSGAPPDGFRALFLWVTYSVCTAIWQAAYLILMFGRRMRSDEVR